MEPSLLMPPPAAPDVPALPGPQGDNQQEWRMWTECTCWLRPHLLPRLWSCSHGARMFAVRPGSAAAKAADGWGGGGGQGGEGAAHASAQAACTLELGPAWEGPRRAPPPHCAASASVCTLQASPPSYRPPPFTTTARREESCHWLGGGGSVNPHNDPVGKVALACFGRWGN